MSEGVTGTEGGGGRLIRVGVVIVAIDSVVSLLFDGSGTVSEVESNLASGRAPKGVIAELVVWFKGARRG
jgi:hypothetical protein